MERIRAKLKTYEEIKKESKEVIETSRKVEIWHPLGRHLKVSYNNIHNYFGREVWIEEWRKYYTGGEKRLFYVYKSKREGKIFDAYGYWFEWIGEPKYILELDEELFVI